MYVRRGAGRHIRLELGEKRLKISGPRHPHVRYWHPLVRDRYLSVTGKLSEHVVIRQQFAFLGQVEEGADARVEQGVEFAPRPWCAPAPAYSPASNNPSTTQYESGIGLSIFSREPLRVVCCEDKRLEGCPHL